MVTIMSSASSSSSSSTTTKNSKVQQFAHLQVLTRSQNRHISSVFSNNSLIASTPVTVLRTYDKDMSSDGGETVDLSARSVLSMIDLTASGDYSTNNKKRLDKHHNLRSSGKKFHRDRSSKFSLTTTNTSPDTSRKVKKKKNKISTTTTTTTTTTIHSHDSNSCSLTTNENMIYSSCLFSPSINPQESQNSPSLLAKKHSNQLISLANGGKENVDTSSSNICATTNNSNSSSGGSSRHYFTHTIRNSTINDGHHNTTANDSNGSRSSTSSSTSSSTGGSSSGSSSNGSRSGGGSSSSTSSSIGGSSSSGGAIDSVSCGGVDCEVEVVVLDFETTGLSSQKHRVIEVAAVILHGDKVVSSFQSLCNPQQRIPTFITKLTGISNEMLLGQPSTEAVMLKLQKFVGNRPIIAHNATFDSKFFFAELARARETYRLSEEWRPNLFICTLKLSRRVLVGLHSHKLSALKHVINFSIADYKEIASSHQSMNRCGSTYHHQDHRALDDVLVTVSLWFHLKKRLDILHNSPGPSAYIHQKKLLLHAADNKKKNEHITVSHHHHTYSVVDDDQTSRMVNSKISFYTLISSMPAKEVSKLLFM